MYENELSAKVIDLCLKVHRQYGPGLLESVYETIFCYEWEKNGIPFTRQQGIPVFHQDIKMEVGYRADVIIDNKLLVDFKSLETIPPVRFKRFRTYLKLTWIVIEFRCEIM